MPRKVARSTPAEVVGGGEDLTGPSAESGLGRPSVTRRAMIVGAVGAIGAAGVVALTGGRFEAQASNPMAHTHGGSPALAGAIPADANIRGMWSEIIPLGLVPIAAAVLPSQKILYWSATGTHDFHGNSAENNYGALTHFGTHNLQTGAISTSTVDTGQEMFCPGTSMLADGRLLVVGGGGVFTRRDAVSSYDWRVDRWKPEISRLANPRWYPSSVTRHDGTVFAIGGDGDTSALSFSRQHMGELWSPSDTSGARWKLFTGMQQLNFRGEEFLSSKAWYYQRVFQNSAGRLIEIAPSTNLIWHDINTGTGSSTIASTRTGTYLQGAITVEYAKDRVLLAGGSKSFGDEDPFNTNAVRVPATDYAYAVNLATGVASPVKRMNSPRYMANGVALPDGTVLAVGGSYFGELWKNADAILEPEVYDPKTDTWTRLARNETARMYHSVALLMPDARVWVGGGGACGTCNGHPEYNHPDAHIFSPPYLFKGPRPTLFDGGDKMTFGRVNTYTISARDVVKFTMVRMASATHAANSDQKVLDLPITSSNPVTGGIRYGLQPPEYGATTPGYWMIFGLNQYGVPSVAKIVQLTW